MAAEGKNEQFQKLSDQLFQLVANAPKRISIIYTEDLETLKKNNEKLTKGLENAIRRWGAIVDSRDKEIAQLKKEYKSYQESMEDARCSLEEQISIQGEIKDNEIAQLKKKVEYIKTLCEKREKKLNIYDPYWNVDLIPEHMAKRKPEIQTLNKILKVIEKVSKEKNSIFINNAMKELEEGS